MKTASKNRTNNLNILIKQYGSQRALGDAVDLPPSYFSQIKNGIRNLGDKAARKIEQALAKPLGWMDQDNSSPSVVATNHHQAKNHPSSDTLANIKEFPKAIKFSPEIQSIIDELNKNKEMINHNIANEIIDFIQFKSYQKQNLQPTEFAVMNMVERLYKSAILGMSDERRKQLQFNDKLQIILEIFHEQYGAVTADTEHQIASVLKKIE